MLPELSVFIALGGLSASFLTYVFLFANWTATRLNPDQILSLLVLMDKATHLTNLFNFGFTILLFTLYGIELD